MLWFRKPLRPAVPVLNTPLALEDARLRQLVSCLNDADKLLSRTKETTSSTDGKKLAEIDLNTFEIHAGAAEVMYGTAIIQLSAADQSAAKEFATAASRYLKYRIEEARKWLKEQS